MPELPEVETIRRDLVKQVLNKKIIKVKIKKSRLVRNSNSFFIKVLTGNKFVKIERIGKLVIFVLERQGYLLTHLKMTGQLIYRDKEHIIAGGHSYGSDKMTYPNKYTYISIEFADQSYLYFNDMRTFGFMQIVAEDELKLIKARFGLEPLTRKFTLVNWQKLFRNRRTNLKALLLNQQLIAGIGNIYADEICFAAGIRPTRQVDKLTKLEIKELFTQTNKIIKQAIAKRGTTFNNYVDTYGKSGNFVKYLKVYGRGGEKCYVCKTEIKKLKHAGRGTHFCPNCQK